MHDLSGPFAEVPPGTHLIRGGVLGRYIVVGHFSCCRTEATLSVWPQALYLIQGNRRAYPFPIHFFRIGNRLFVFLLAHRTYCTINQFTKLSILHLCDYNDHDPVASVLSN